MKIRIGFVSNSSSTSFMIINKTSQYKDLTDFVEETPYLLEEYNREYGESISYDELLESAKENNEDFMPQESKECVFGDEDRTTIGRVYDYILRDSGESESFQWYFLQYLR